MAQCAELKDAPSNHAGSDQETFWLQPVTGSVQPELGWIIHTGSEFLHPFHSVFLKKAWAIPCKTDPDPI